MERISNAVIKNRKIIVAIFLAVTVISSFLLFFVSVNYDMVDYLPKDANSTQALSIMEEEFAAAVPNLRVMVNDVSLQQALDYKDKLGNVEGVSGVMWLDDVEDLKTPVEMMEPDSVEAYYKDNKALFNITVNEGCEVKAIDDIYEIIGENNSLSGDALDTATSQKMAGKESLNAMLILVPIIILILLASTSSWAEPLFFLLTIGISVLINLGTNIMFGEISFVTNAVSPILQLAVSLDYAIFLLNSFADYRAKTESVEEAMKLAIKRAFPAVAASAATTLFGFLALMFMKFRIGFDLGMNLVKGIALSFVSVMVFLPAVTLCLYKWIDKTSHKRILPKFKRVGNIVTKVKIPCLVVVLILIIPSFLAQGKNSFTYGMGDLSPNSRSGMDTMKINEEFGKSTAIVLLVPKGDVVKELRLSNELENIEHVTGVVSYAKTVGKAIPPEYLDDSITSQFYSENYSRIILYTNTENEGDLAFSVVENVKNKTAEYYGSDFYACGQSVNLFDMKNTVTKDNKIVNLIAVITIALVLLITFKSVSLPLILLISIETAIWINLSIPYFMNSSLCYIGYLVINTVQLGATVDYAILFTENYRRYRVEMSAKEAVKRTLGKTFSSILISASILTAAGFCLFLTSSNSIVSELGLLLGRGTILSMLMVICFLPTMLVIFDRLIGKTTKGSNYYKE